MSRCHHHPGADVLMDYSAGNIDGIHRLMIEMHLKVCSHCAKAVNEMEALGGQMLEEAAPVPMAKDSFDQLMSKIQTADATEEIAEPGYAQIIDQVLSKGAVSQLNWHWRTKRFAEIPLSVNDERFEAKLIYFKKGMKVPKHTHRDKEYTLVLQGAFSDDSGTYERGDYVCKTGAHEHAPVAESDCVCLAITTQPLKFTGTFGPVLNWFLN